MDLYKIADIGDQQKNHKQFWTAVKSLPRGDHPDTWDLIFKSHNCDVIDNSQIF